MKNVSIDSIDIVGFGVYVEPFHFDFNRKGVNIIKGINGKGKTTIFSAMTWGLYGVNLKGVVKGDVVSWKHLRPKGFKGTQVAVHTTIDGVAYDFVRHIKFKGTYNDLTGGDSLMIWQNGELISQGKKIEDAQEMIDDIMGLDGKLFLNSVMFAQRSKKFINADNKDKREVLEQVFDLEWVSQAAEIAKKEATRLSEEVKQLEAEYQQINTPYTAKLSAYNANSVNYSENVARNDRDTQEVQQTIQQTEAQITEKEALLSQHKAEEVADKVNSLGIELNALNLAYSGKLAEFNKLKSDQGVRDSQAQIHQQTKNTALARITQLESDKSGYEALLAKRRESKATELEVLDRKFIACGVEIQKLDTAILELSAKQSQIVPKEASEIESKINYLFMQVHTLDEKRKASYSRIAEIQHQIEHISDPCPRCGEIINPDRREAEQARLNAEANAILLDITEVISPQLEAADKELGEWRQHKEDRADWETITKLLNNAQFTKNSQLTEKATIEQQIQALTSGAEEVRLTQQIAHTVEVMAEQSLVVFNMDNLILDIQKQDKHSELLAMEESLQQESQHIKTVGLSLEQYRQTQLSLASALSDIANLKDILSKSQYRQASLIDESDALALTAQSIQKDYEELMELYNRLADTDTRRRALQEEMDRYKFWQSTGFGTSGIKSLLFSVMLSKLNVSMQTYSQRLGVSARFLVNMDKARRDIEVEALKDGHVVGYDNLSGGEQARIDVISVFGMHDLIAAADVNLNILVLDECTENLDQTGTDEVFNLIKYKQQTTPSVWVITHNPEVNITNANIIEL